MYYDKSNDIYSTNLVTLTWVSNTNEICHVADRRSIGLRSDHRSATERDSV